MAISIINRFKTRIRGTFRSFLGEPDYDQLVEHYTPDPITFENDYERYKKRTIPKRIRRLVRNYRRDPDNFEISAFDIVFNEIDSVTSREMHNIHAEYRDELSTIRNNVAEVVPDINATANEIAQTMQQLEDLYVEMQHYLTEYRRPVIATSGDPADEIVIDGILPDTNNNN